eukprot:gene26306-biopygen15722
MPIPREHVIGSFDFSSIPVANTLL